MNQPIIGRQLHNVVALQKPVHENKYQLLQENSKLKMCSGVYSPSHLEFKHFYYHNNLWKTFKWYLAILTKPIMAIVKYIKENILNSKNRLNKKVI